MSTIAVPSSVQSWPRAALAAVAALLVALVATVSLFLTIGSGRHTTRTVFQQLDQPISCQFNHPC